MNLNSLNAMLAEGGATGAAPNPTGQMITVVGYVKQRPFFSSCFYFMAILLCAVEKAPKSTRRCSRQ